MANKGTRNSNLLTVQEACAYLKVCRTTLYQWVALRLIRRVRRGRYVRFQLRELDRFLEMHSKQR